MDFTEVVSEDSTIWCLYCCIPKARATHLVKGREALYPTCKEHLEHAKLMAWYSSRVGTNASVS